MRPETGRIVSVLRRNLQLTRGRSPGSQMAPCAGPLSFPDAVAEWYYERLFLFTVAGARPHRPGLPFQTLSGTIGQFIFTTTIQHLPSDAALSGLFRRVAVVLRDLFLSTIQRKTQGRPTSAPAS